MQKKSLLRIPTICLALMLVFVFVPVPKASASQWLWANPVPLFEPLSLSYSAGYGLLAEPPFLGGPNFQLAASALQVTVSLAGATNLIGNFGSGNYLGTGMATTSFDTTAGGLLAIDYGWNYVVYIDDNGVPFLNMECWKLGEYTMQIWNLLSEGFYNDAIHTYDNITLKMQWVGASVVFSVSAGPVNETVYTFDTSSYTTMAHYFEVGSVKNQYPLIGGPDVKYFQFMGAWSPDTNPGANLNWNTGLINPQYLPMNETTWSRVGIAYTTTGWDSFLDNGWCWGDEPDFSDVRITGGYDNDPFGASFTHLANQQISTGPGICLWFLPGGSGGCPYVSTWDGTQYVLDNNILPAAEMSKGADVQDYYTLQQPLVPTYEGRAYSLYSLQVSEFEHEHDYIDQAKLFAVDHNSSVDVGVSPNGEILTYSNPVPAISAVDNNGADVLPLLNSVDGNYYQGYNGSYVTLTFAPADVSSGVKLVIREEDRLNGGPPTAKCPVYVQVLNPTEDWNTVTTLQTRTHWATDVINMTGYLPDHQGKFKVRLCFIAADRIDYVGMDTTPQSNIRVHVAELVSAVSSSQGDVTRLLRADDGKYAELLPGQQIVFTFKLPTNQNSQRTFIFYSIGHYYTIDS
jgi:hypothetical protein